MAQQNVSLQLQALSHDVVESQRGKFCLRFGGVPTDDHVEGVTYDGDAAGTVHFRLYFPSAKSVVIRSLISDVNLTREESEGGGGGANKGVWVGTASYPVGFRYVFLLVDGQDVLSPYMPLGFGYSRPMNYLEIPPPAPVPGRPPCCYLLREGIERGTVAGDFFESSVTGKVEKVLIYLPPSYHKGESRDRHYPVLYLQHGHGENENGWVYQGKLNIILDNLLADRAAEEMVVVMGAGMVFRDGKTDAFFYCEQLVKDIIPFVEARYRIAAGREHRAIAGLSMGSMQASVLSITRQDLFSAAGLFSGFLRTLDGHIGGNDAHIEVLKRDPKHYQQSMKVYFRCMGDQDPFMPVFLEDDKILEEVGVVSTRKIYEGGHIWQTWRLAAADFLPLLFRK